MIMYNWNIDDKQKSIISADDSPAPILTSLWKVCYPPQNATKNIKSAPRHTKKVEN